MSRYQVNYQLRSHKRDSFIEFVKSLLLNPFVLHSGNLPNSGKLSRSHVERYCEVLEHVEALIDELREHSQQGTETYSRLYSYVPSIGCFFTRLPLRDGFLLQNERYHIAARRFVPPSFNDIRRILNSSQILAIASEVKLITFDGDVTLYEDGGSLHKTSPLTDMLIDLLSSGLYVAVVTAAGYTDATRYEQRVQGLLDSFSDRQLPRDVTDRFFIVGGECNYLLKVKSPEMRLEFEPIEPQLGDSVSEEDIQRLLDISENQLRVCIHEMHLNATIIRKQRSVGLIAAVETIDPMYISRCTSPVGDPPVLEKEGKIQPRPSTRLHYQMEREQLDECVLATKNVLRMASLQTDVHQMPPYCVFNGGRDVWVDVGNKLIGVKMLQRLLNSASHETLHIGDQFLSTGNDIATVRFKPPL